MTKTPINFLKRPGQHDLAYVYSPGDNSALPLVMFCGGYNSDMNGTKATYFEAQCCARGQGFLRFDYSGHGASGGRFETGTIGQWAQDAQDMLDHIAAVEKRGKILLIGSSMGGWIALILARRRPEKLCGLIGIAAAPDFTADMYHNRLSPQQRQQLETQPFIDVENYYGAPPYRFTKEFFEDGFRQSVLSEALSVNFPVRLFQGGQDADVDPGTPARIMAVLQGPDTQVVMVQDGDHRLSRPQDLALMDRGIVELSRI
jgi:pimeloyl-ACP methyl ester carboxylesterase